MSTSVVRTDSKFTALYIVLTEIHDLFYRGEPSAKFKLKNISRIMKFRKFSLEMTVYNHLIEYFTTRLAHAV